MRVVLLVLIGVLLGCGELYASAESAYWPMDDVSGTTVIDDSGNGNAGTSQRDCAVLTVGGKVGSALSFNGSTDYVSVPDGLINFGAAFTIAFWVKNDSAWVYTSVCGWASAGSTYWMVDIYSNPNTVEFHQYAKLYVRGPMPSTVGEWVHVALVVDQSGTSCIYVNGSPVETTVINQGPMSQINGMSVGAMGGYYGNYHPLAGALDDFRVYPLGLSAESVSALYAMGGGGGNSVCTNVVLVAPVTNGSWEAVIQGGVGNLTIILSNALYTGDGGTSAGMLSSLVSAAASQAAQLSAVKSELENVNRNLASPYGASSNTVAGLLSNVVDQLADIALSAGLIQSDVQGINYAMYEHSSGSLESMGNMMYRHMWDGVDDPQRGSVNSYGWNLGRIRELLDRGIVVSGSNLSVQVQEPLRVTIDGEGVNPSQETELGDAYDHPYVMGGPTTEQEEKLDWSKVKSDLSTEKGDDMETKSRSGLNAVAYGLSKSTGLSSGVFQKRRLLSYDFPVPSMLGGGTYPFRVGFGEEVESAVGIVRDASGLCLYAVGAFLCVGIIRSAFAG